MPNPKILSDLLKAAGKLPKGSKAAQEAVSAEMAAREAAQRAAYAGHTPPTETGQSSLSTIRDILESQEFPVRKMATGGKTRAGTKAEPFPWEEALEAQLGRTKKRLKGLATDPVQEGVNIVRQYLHDPTLSPEENERKLEEFMFGFVGSTNLPKPALQKASEVFGKQEGKTAMYTQADRTKVGGGFLGGPGFSGLQLELPAYKEAEAAWGVAHPAVAKTIVGSNKRVPEGQAIWAPMLGHPEQHRSNQMVFDQIFNQFRREAKKGNLDKELHQKINDRLASAVDKEGKPLFPPDVDIMNKNFRQLANTFDRRAIAADVMAGKGVGGRKGSIIDYPKIIESTTDPAVIDAPSGSVGHRAFTLTGDVGFHPELHPAFPYILRGEDIGQTYTPIPKELAFMDFIEKVRKEKGRDPGYMDFTRGYAPQQFISEDWLTNLQKHGFAKGGLAMATGGQAFPLQEEFQAEVERRAARPRTRAGVPVEDTNVLGGALRGLANTLGGLAFGRTIGTLGMPADILEPTAAPGAMIPMFGMAGMPSEISKALVQQFAPKGPDIPAPTSEYLLEKGLEKFKPPQEFEVSAKLGRFMPFDISEMQAAGRKLKALQPTFTELMETGLERATAPTRMYAAPEDGAKLSKEEYSRMMREKYAAQNAAKAARKEAEPAVKEAKAPANKVGFYNPAEKAALNLERKIGSGDEFISDLKKQPGVTDERLAELGLDQFKGRPNVTREEIIAATEENRVPLQESVRRPFDEEKEMYENVDYLRNEVNYIERGIKDIEKQIDEMTAANPNHPQLQERKEKLEFFKNKLEETKEKMKNAEPAMFGPDAHPEYNMPGGSEYREIRIKLPESDESFKHTIHHGEESNVLLHLRVANHADAEGKKGLLIDELQSDWHQEGSKKGYKAGIEKEYNRYFESLRDRFIAEQKQQNIKAGMTPTDAEYYATEMYSGLAQREGYPGIARALGEEDKMIELSNQYKRDIYSVPDAPFKDNWYQIGLKRAIKEAADTGMDRVYLTTGNRQALRYSEDQRKGMEQWYDKTYKNYLEKYAKQHGGKLGTTTIANGEPVYYIDITDAMRESAKKGQSYKDGGAVHPAVEKFAASLPHPAVTEFESRVIDLGDMITGGGAIDLSTKVVGSYAMGGAAYNTIPDVSDAEKMVQGPAF